MWCWAPSTLAPPLYTLTSSHRSVPKGPTSVLNQSLSLHRPELLPAWVSPTLARPTHPLWGSPASSHRQGCCCPHSGDPEPEVELLYAGCRVQTGSQSKCPCLSSLSRLVLLEAVSRDRYMVPRAGTLASSARDMDSPATLGVAPNNKTHACLPLSSGCPPADGSGEKCLPTRQHVGVFLCPLTAAPPPGGPGSSEMPQCSPRHTTCTLATLWVHFVKYPELGRV